MMISETFESTAATVANKASVVGSLGSVLAWFNSSSFGMWAGIVIGVIGLTVNWYFKIQSNTREKQAHAAFLRKMAKDTDLAPLPMAGPYADD